MMDDARDVLRENSMEDLIKAVLAFRDEREWRLASGTIHLTYFFGS